MLKDIRIFLFNWFLLLGFFVATVPDVLVLGSSEAAKTMDQNPLPNTCRYIRANSVLEARCFQLDPHEIPLDLNPDIQVLNITGNMLMKLSNDTLHPYKKLIVICLRNNWLNAFGKAVFANQPYLEVLDLTSNIIYNLPESFFQLPNLHTLYLGRNLLSNLVFKVTSPLRLLELSKNKLTAIPNIGVQPTLLNLDVSHNFITSIATKDLAPFCSLKNLDLTENSIRFNASSCDCQTFNAWVKLRQIKMKPTLLKCTNSPPLNEDCANVRFSNRTYELFNECLAMLQQKMETAKPRSVWISVVSCVSVLLFVVFVALFCVHKRYRRRHMKQGEQLTMIYDNTKLLEQQFDDN